MADEMKKYEIALKAVQKVGEDYYLFDFTVPKELKFKAGQYGAFLHVDKEVEGKKVRAFSIASTPNEAVFKVGTKIIDVPSDFKKKMLELKVGDLMSFTGPMGKFLLKEKTNSIFIAGGIGITPIRGLIKQLEEQKTKEEAVLIYSEARGIYPYKAEFDNLTFLDSYYETTREKTKAIIDQVSLKYVNNANYYVAGSPGFVQGIKEQLLSNQVLESNILFDRFPGY